MDDQLPAKIGKYDIIGIAGKGAMGIVYVGHDPFVDRRVAIKVSTQEGQEGMDAKARRMFFNEAKAAGALDHPNILKIYEAGEAADGQPYIVMEYVPEADTLRSFTDPERLLPIGTVVRYMVRCAQALDYAHRRGVVHRDIKPANIMLTGEGEVKIGDFGIAQRVAGDQTQLLGWFGSPLYMSPEQAADREVSSRSDLFSLGVVMYQLLTGETPFTAKGISGLIYNILNKDPLPVHALRPEVPLPLSQVVMRCLEKDPDRRFQTGQELAEALEAAMAGLEVPLLALSPEEQVEHLRGLSFFQGFADAELREFQQVARWEHHPAGTEIIREGEQGDTFYVLIEGEVSVRYRDKEIAALRDGECFGEMGYLGGARRSAGVVATTDVVVARIDRPVREWASLPMQLRLGRVFQQVLIERLERTGRELARRL